MVKNQVCKLMIDYNKKEVYLVDLYDFGLKSSILKDIKTIKNILYKIEINYDRV